MNCIGDRVLKIQCHLSNVIELKHSNRAVIVGPIYAGWFLGCFRVAEDTLMIDGIHTICWGYPFSGCIFSLFDHVVSLEILLRVSLSKRIPRLNVARQKGITDLQVLLHLLSHILVGSSF